MGSATAAGHALTCQTSQRMLAASTVTEHRTGWVRGTTPTSTASSSWGAWPGLPLITIDHAFLCVVSCICWVRHAAMRTHTAPAYAPSALHCRFTTNWRVESLAP